MPHGRELTEEYMLTIVSWNCSWEKGGFSKDKYGYIVEKYSPNILIIQECKYDECVQVNSGFSNFTWYGDGKDSELGIGILSNDYKFKLIPEFRYDVNFRYVVPYSFSLKDMEIILFAIWTKKSIDKDFHNLSYIYNVHKAIDYYKNIMNRNIVLIGDFNSADKPNEREGGHLELVSKLSTYGIYNCMPKDRETQPTYFHRFDAGHPCTDDYCFASDKIKISGIEVGESCLNYSDHCPLIVTLDY
jgi:exonuclease III